MKKISKILLLVAFLFAFLGLALWAGSEVKYDYSTIENATSTLKAMKALDNAALAMFCIAVISTAGAIVCRIAHCLGKNKPKSVSAE